MVMNMFHILCVSYIFFYYSHSFKPNSVYSLYELCFSIYERKCIYDERINNFQCHIMAENWGILVCHVDNTCS